MTKELKKRLITSIILFILALLCILINYIEIEQPAFENLRIFLK